MPYILTGYDSAGLRHDYDVDDSGTVSGGEQLTGWLGENPFEKPEPIEGETAPESGAMTPSQVDAMRQHMSKVLTYVNIIPLPLQDETPTDPEAPIDALGRRARGMNLSPTDLPERLMAEHAEAREARAAQRHGVTQDSRREPAHATQPTPTSSQASHTSHTSQTTERRPSAAELDAMTASELRERARAAGVPGYAGMNKPELVAALSAPQRAGSER